MANQSSQTRRYLLLLVLASSGVCLLCWLYPELMESAGMGPMGRWFLDTHTVLGAIEADWKGLDAYAYNAISGPHWYSHWWLTLDALRLTQADTRWLGPLISGSALVVAWLTTRPRTALELRWALIVLCSAPFILGLNRANADLLLFTLLSLCVPLLSAPVRFWRIVGAPVLIALAAGLKYYPATAGLILLAVRPARDRNLALALGVGLLVLTGLSVGPDVVHYTANEPTTGFYTFGALTLFLAAGLPTAFAPWLSLGFLALAGWVILRRTSLRSWSPPAAQQADYLAFILGAVILTGCFVATINYVYRWIFLVWMLPFLCRLDVARTHPGLHNLQIATRLLIGLALWTEVPVVTALNLIGTSQEVVDRWEDWTTGFLQFVTWSLFACLCGWLAHFVVMQGRAWFGPVPAETADG